MRGVVAAALAVALVACGAVRHQIQLEPGLALDEPLRVEVGDVTNASGKLFDVPAEQMLRDALSKELTGVDLLWTDPTVGRHLILAVQILDYEPGDAFKRWLMPGYGSTVLSVRGELNDTSKGTLIGSFEARRTVSFGGAYSIGAWHTIFGKVAEDVAEDLKKALAQPERDQKP